MQPYVQEGETSSYLPTHVVVRHIPTYTYGWEKHTYTFHWDKHNYLPKYVGGRNIYIMQPCMLKREKHRYTFDEDKHTYLPKHMIGRNILTYLHIWLGEPYVIIWLGETYTLCNQVCKRGRNIPRCKNKVSSKGRASERERERVGYIEWVNDRLVFHVKWFVYDCVVNFILATPHASS